MSVEAKVTVAYDNHDPIVCLDVDGNYWRFSVEWVTGEWVLAECLSDGTPIDDGYRAIWWWGEGDENGFVKRIGSIGPEDVEDIVENYAVHNDVHRELVGHHVTYDTNTDLPVLRVFDVDGRYETLVYHLYEPAREIFSGN